LLLFGLYLNPLIAAGLGVIYLVGRFLYLFAYVKDPKKREVGFALSMLPIMILLVGGLVGAARAAWLR